MVVYSAAPLLLLNAQSNTHKHTPCILGKATFLDESALEINMSLDLKRVCQNLCSSPTKPSRGILKRGIPIYIGIIETNYVQSIQLVSLLI